MQGSANGDQPTTTFLQFSLAPCQGELALIFGRKTCSFQRRHHRSTGDTERCCHSDIWPGTDPAWSLRLAADRLEAPHTPPPIRGRIRVRRHQSTRSHLAVHKYQTSRRILWG